MQKRSEETRAKILQAASQLFSCSGFDATGVAEICQLAGVSKGAFYHHFATKQAVFVALLDNWLGGLDARLGQLFAQADNVPSGLVAMASISREVFETAQGQLPLFLEYWRESSHDPRVWNATIEPYRHYTDLFAGLVRRGTEEGSFDEVDPQTTARVIVALALGVILQGVMDPGGAAWNDVTRAGVQIIMRGIGKREL